MGDQQKIIQIYDHEGLASDTIEAEAIVSMLVVKYDALDKGVEKLEEALRLKEQQLLAEQVNLNDALEVIKKLSTHASSQENSGWVEVGKGSTHKENNVQIFDDDIYEVGGVKYLKNTSQTQASSHKQTQMKQANKAKRKVVSSTPNTLCLDIGFRQCV